MIAGPIVTDIGSPLGAGPVAAPGPPGRLLRRAGIALVALSIVSAVAWAVLVSPFGFIRYPLSARDRTFTLHSAGTYVVFLEGPGESHAQLPPALDVGVAGLSGQQATVRTLGSPGRRGASGGYRLWGHEGQAIATVTVHHPGTFLVTIEPKASTEIDPSGERIVGDAGVAMGRAWSNTWLAGPGGAFVISAVPALSGLALLAMGRRRRSVR